MTPLQQAAQELVHQIYYMGATPLDWPEYTALEDALEAEQAQAVEPTFSETLAEHGIWLRTEFEPKPRDTAPPAQQEPSLSLDLLERLSKTLINLGYSTPEGGMEHFGARIESQLYNLCRGVDAILAQQVAVPAGYVLVPVEPTEEMIVALMCTGLRHAEYKAGCDPTIAHMAQGYSAMLAAAQGAKP